MPKTAVGLFKKGAAVKEAIGEIEALGFPRRDVRILGEPLDFASTGVMDVPHIEFELDLNRELRRIGATGPEADTYVEGVRHGGTLVFATHAEAARVDRAAEVMNGYGAAAVEEISGPSPHIPPVVHADLPPSDEAGVQTGRTRQSSGGAAVFTW